MEDNRASTLLLCTQCGAETVVVGTRNRKSHITRERRCPNGHTESSLEMMRSYYDELVRKAAEYDYIVRRLEDIMDRERIGETNEETN